MGKGGLGGKSTEGEGRMERVGGGKEGGVDDIELIDGGKEVEG